MGQLSRGNGVTLSSGAVTQARVSPEETCCGKSLRGPLRAGGDPYVGLFHEAYSEGMGEARRSETVELNPIYLEVAHTQNA